MSPGSLSAVQLSGVLRMCHAAGDCAFVDDADRDARPAPRVSDANGMYFADNNILRERLGYKQDEHTGIGYSWYVLGSHSSTPGHLGYGKSINLEEITEGKRIYVVMVFQDDLDHWERPRSELSAKVAPPRFKIKRDTRVVRDGSRCDYVYPAREGCDAETSVRDLGDPLQVVNTTTGNVVTEGVTFSVKNPSKRILSDEFGVIHEVEYNFAITADGRLRTVIGEAYPYLESPICGKSKPDDECAPGSITRWGTDDNEVEVEARRNGEVLAKGVVEVRVTRHQDAVQVRDPNDTRCKDKRCYGRRLVPGQTLYSPTLKEQLQRSVEEPPETARELSVEFTNVPGEHNGKGFKIELEFSENVFTGKEDFNHNVALREALLLTNAKAPGAKKLLGANAYRKWRVLIKPTGRGPITIGLKPPKGECTERDPTCTPDGRKLAEGVEIEVPGLATLTATGDTVHEAPGATLEFGVKLSRETENRVTVKYTTSDGSATAGSDYEAASGTLTFEPGETKKTVLVTVLDDSVDEGAETVKFTLSDASGAHIDDETRTATGTIENTDHMPAAWLSRFGRTVGEQILDAARHRLTTPPATGTRVTIAGLSPWHERVLAVEDPGLTRMSTGMRGEWNSGPEPASRDFTTRDLLTGTSFSLAAESGDGATLGVWAQGALSDFSGREDELSIDGDVSSVMLGADWTGPRWTAGALVAHSMGKGTYTGPDSGTVESDITGLYPYGQHALSRRLSVWGVAGYGTGTLALTPEGHPNLETDIDLAMAAVGLRGVLLEAPVAGGPELTAVTDVMGVRTDSEAVRDEGDGAGNLAAANTEVSRVRLGVEGAWAGLRLGEVELKPTLELGLRRDGGDAETGTGIDVGAGVAWSNPGAGLSASMHARGLLTHESDEFQDRGLSGSLAWDARPQSDRGLKVRLAHTTGAPATGGMQSLLSRTTLEGLDLTDRSESAPRLELGLGYGVPAFDGLFTATPELGLGLSGGEQRYRLGWRLGLATPDPHAMELKLDLTRNERPAHEPAVHGIGITLTARW